MKMILKKLTCVIVFYLLQVSAYACQLGGDLPEYNISKSDSIFVAEVSGIGGNSYYTELKVEVLETLYGERLSGETSIYVKGNWYGGLSNIFFQEKYIFAVTSNDPVLGKFFGNEAILDVNAKWVLSDGCEHYIVEHNENSLENLFESIVKDLNRREAILKDNNNGI